MSRGRDIRRCERNTCLLVTRWVEDVLLKTCRVWVAVRDAEILGYAAVEGDMLEHLYLRPDVRRQGIGALLLDEVRRHSPEGVSLHIFQQNTDARSCYERHGFTIIDSSDGRGTWRIFQT